MTGDEKQIAQEVHERLLAARLATDENDDLARAAQIAAIDPNSTAPRDHARFVACVASNGCRGASKKPGAPRTANNF